MSLSIKTAQEELAELRKPSLDLATPLVLTSDDWLVVCAGFEDRALEALKRVSASENSFNVLLILYEPFLPQNKVDDLRQLCALSDAQCVEAVYDRQDPSAFGERLLTVLAAQSGRIFVDVSAMSRLLIVQAIVALRTRPKGLTDCFVVYTEAETYPPSEAEAEAEIAKSAIDPTLSVLFLSSGVFEVTVVPELSSFAPAAPQTRLIAFPSLDAHQLIALRNELQPSRISFIEGLPPDSRLLWRKEVVSRVNRLGEIRKAERFTTSTLDYTETLNLLLDLYSAHSIQERLIISPTGSKMQTVAVGIFRAFLEDVQIVYPTPQDFRSPDGYTLGARDVGVLPLAAFSIRGN
jgi:hypothetical protein